MNQIAHRSQRLRRPFRFITLSNIIDFIFGRIDGEDMLFTMISVVFKYYRPLLNNNNYYIYRCMYIENDNIRDKISSWLLFMFFLKTISESKYS